MAHCPYEKLDDIESELKAIRKLDKVKEPKPGIFYLKSKGFLHFHVKDSDRWADVRDGVNWGKPIPLGFNPTKKSRTAFLKAVTKRHKNTLGT